MDIITFLLDLLKTTLAFILGTVVSMVITGVMVNHFVIKKIMHNKDIKEIIKLIRQVKDELSEHNENGKT
jgi:uncharacterized membrane protein